MDQSRFVDCLGSHRWAIAKMQGQLQADPYQLTEEEYVTYRSPQWIQPEQVVYPVTPKKSRADGIDHFTLRISSNKYNTQQTPPEPKFLEPVHERQIQIRTQFVTEGFKQQIQSENMKDEGRHSLKAKIQKILGKSKQKAPVQKVEQCKMSPLKRTIKLFKENNNKENIPMRQKTKFPELSLYQDCFEQRKMIYRRMENRNQERNK